MGPARARSAAVSHRGDDKLCDHYRCVYWLTWPHLQSVDLRHQATLSVNITGLSKRFSLSLTCSISFLSLSFLPWVYVREAWAGLFSLRAEIIITLSPWHFYMVERLQFVLRPTFSLNKGHAHIIIYHEYTIINLSQLNSTACDKRISSIMKLKYHLLLQCQISCIMFLFLNTDTSLV